MSAQDDYFREAAKSERSMRRFTTLSIWLILSPIIVGVLCAVGFLIFWFANT